MARIETWFEQDLKKPVIVHKLDSVFSQDAKGNLIGVKVFSDGVAVALTDSITGYCVLADGSTVPVSGSRSGNQASIILPASAYNVLGPIMITVKNTGSDYATTLCAVAGLVVRSRTGSQVDPGSVVTDWTNQISAQLQAVQTAADNLGSVLAVPFSNLTAYSAGNYVMKDGNLYCFTTDHAAGDWNSSQVRNVKLANEVADLKSAFIDEAIAEFGVIDLGTLNSGAYIKKSDGAYSTSTAWAYTNYIATGSNKALMFTCPEYSNASILSNTAAIAFYTSATNGAYISGSGIDIIKGTAGNYRWIVVPVPQTAKYFRASIPNSISSNYKIIEIESVENLCQKIANIETTLADTKNIEAIETVTSFGGTGDTYADLTELPNNTLCRATNAPDRPYWIAANNGFWVLTARAKNYATWIQIGFAARTGDVAVRYKGTSTSAYSGWVSNNRSRKSVRVLCIGNSYTCDNIGYMPYILENITPDIDLYLTIAFYPSSSIDDHIAAFDDDTVSYFKCVHEPGATAWVRPAERDATLKQILASEQWDFITFQQASLDQSTWSTYANLNTLIDKVVGYVNGLGNHSVRLGWFMPHIRKSIETASSYSDMIQCVQNVLSTTPIDFVIPCGTAVQNARGTSLDSLGDSGHLTYDSNGGHLQEGLPCMIGAYTVTIKLLELCGMAYMGVMGNGILPTSEWLYGKYIPNPQGTSVGATTGNCYIAQKCAVAAVKKPYDVTQIAE